ncbi:MAG TPA: c-type cytochrome [Usitatibacter sp.]|nr:c-type cytochrome [Usitatibacter sp.]
MHGLRSSLPAAMLACGFAAAALAQQPAPAPAFTAPDLTPKGVRAMAAACAMCHGTSGRPAEGSSVPRLAGRPAESMIGRMKEFKEGKREASVMHQIAKGYGDNEIAAMAAYFEKEGS